MDEARNTFLSAGGRGNIRMELPPDLPLVMADRRRIVQVLNNLLSNAARHSPDGGDQGERHNGGYPYRDIGHRRGQGHLGREPSAPVPEILQARHEDWGGAPDFCLREARGTHPCRERRARPDVHASLRRSRCRSLRAVPSVALGARRAASTRPRILTVDDDPHTLRYVRYVLSKAGFATVMTADPHDVSRLEGGRA